MNTKARSYLNHSAIENPKLKGLDDLIWFSFGERTYARNANLRGRLFAQTFFFTFVIASIVFFEYLPFKIFGFMFMMAASAVAIIMPIKYANESPYMIWINVILGSLGLLTSWHFGLQFFGFHLEKYFFWIYFLGGLLAVYRRFWNHLIWKKLDAVIVLYNLKN